MHRLWILFLLFAFVVAITACSSSDGSDNEQADDDAADDDVADDDAIVSESVSLHIVGGNMQAGFIGQTLAAKLQVQVRLGDGTAAANQVVRFDRLTGIGEGKAQAMLSPGKATTGDDGIASCTVTFGPTPGMLRVKASLADHSARPVIFHASAFPQTTDNKKPISFISVNDFHAHLTPWGHPDDKQGGLARIVKLFQTIRENNDQAGIQTVIMDAGDDFENTLYNDVPGFLSWLVEAWDRAGVDVWQVGNHDFHFGIPFLTDKLLAARENFTDGAKGHPMVITFGNIDPSTLREDLQPYAEYFETAFSDPLDQLLFQQTALLQVGPIRVGFLGVVTDVAVYTQVPGDPFFLRAIGAANPNAEGATFINPDPRKSDYIAGGIDRLINEGAHIVVVTSHAGLGFDDRVNLPPGKDDVIALYGIGALSGRPVDLLISAHSHVQLNQPIIVPNPAGGQTPIVQAREGGLFAARVDAMVDIQNGGLEVLDSRLIQINSDLDEDPGILEAAQSWREKAIEQYGDWFSQKLIESDVWLSHRAETISGLGKLINDSFVWAIEQEEDEDPVDASIAVPSLYRADLWPGSITAEQAYDVLPLHKMDNEGHAPDTIATMTFRSGYINAAMLPFFGEWRWHTTAIEFALEVIHTMPDILDLIPMMGEQLNIDVIQISNVEYEVDVSAPRFHHVVPGSVKINGQPVDPQRTYKLAMVHSMASTLVYALNTIVIATSEEGGVVKILLDDPDTGEPFHDTEIPIWQAFQDYLGQLPSETILPKDVTITGEKIRTVQPDLAINSTDIAVGEARRGGTAHISVLVRNMGNHGVENATVRVFVDSTPWDLTDQDDGRAVLEGLGEDYLGSLTEVAVQTISVGAYPDTELLQFEWNVPTEWPPGLYTVHVRVEDITCGEIDANTGLPFTDWLMDNNGGEQVMNYFYIED